MNTFELQPVESARAGETAEAAQAQELDEATYAPENRIEQTGDYRQSEAIQVDFTAVVDNTAAAADAREYAGETAHAGETPAGVATIADAGERNTVLGRQPKAAGVVQPAPAAVDERDTVRGNQPQSADAQLQYDGLAPMPADHQAYAPEPVLAGAEDRDTVCGRQPKAADAPQPAPSVADERDTILGSRPEVADAPVGKKHGPGVNGEGVSDTSDYENIDIGRHFPPHRKSVRMAQQSNAGDAVLEQGQPVTDAPIDRSVRVVLPGAYGEDLPRKGQITGKKGDGSGIHFDPVTGQMGGSLDGSGPGAGTEKPAHANATMRKADSGLETLGNTAAISDVMPPQARPKDQDKASHIPIGPGISYGPPTVQERGGIGKGSQQPVGPQELFNDRFARQALDAIGYGLIGAKSGVKGKAYGVGAGGHGAGKTQWGLGTDTGIDYGDGYSSSGGGAPAHNYGPGSHSDGKGKSKPKDKGGGDTIISVTTNSQGTTAIVKETSKGRTCQGTAEAITETAFNAGTKGESTGSAAVICKDKSKGAYIIEWNKQGSTMFHTKSNTFEGGSPMPYTGGFWGIEAPKNPGTIGGRDGENDDAKLMPVIRNSGLGYQGGGGTNATDGPGSWDDGNWYGGIFGGGDVFSDNGGPLPIDPKPNSRS
jgi:hypothetical protein